VCGDKKASRNSPGQVVFDSEKTVAEKGWKTYALCVSILVFYLFNIAVILSFLGSLLSWHTIVIYVILFPMYMSFLVKIDN
jgi:hypothetical protein